MNDPSSPIAITAPPPVPRATGTGTVTRLLIPAVTLLAGGGMMAAIVLSGASISRNPMFVLFPVMMLGSAIASAVQGGGGRQRAAELNADRARYLSYLHSQALRLTDSAVVQREWMYRRHPAPEALWVLAGGPRMWERRRADPDFGEVRVGVGTVAAVEAPIDPGGEPHEGADPVTWTALRRFLRVHSTVSSAPVTVALTGATAVTINGDSADARALVRAMVCQLAVLHSPDDLAVVAVVADSSARHWDWLKWLPHHRHPSMHDQLGALRMVYSTLSAALAAVPPDRCVVVVTDGVAGADAPGAGVTVLEIGTADAGSQVTVTVPGQDDIVAVPDLMTQADAIICARRMAGYRRADPGAHGPASSWPELIGIPAIPVAGEWKALWDSVGARRLQVPIGHMPSGAALELDIREAAEGGMGPHGLCVGATGSGKSELLRSIALGMIARHSPEALNLVLIDFKGGATFLGLDRANHVSAVITNLAEEAHLVDRMRDALTGEINRRQHILRSAGDLAGIADYHRARRAGRPLAPLPALFVIVDEFSELLAQQPEFIDVFVAIGRLGRSLGMHLLLASQRIEEGRLRGLDAHLSYRICLRTLSASESRLSIGVPDAYELPGEPGAAYLKIAAAEPIRFQSTYVSGRIAPAAPMGAVATGPMVFTAAPVGPTVQACDGTGSGVSVADALLDSLTGHGPAAHQIWLPPLVESPTLHAVLAQPRSGGDLMVPIGLADNTFEQYRGPLVLNLAGSAGNIAIVGGPQSGKSTLLRTVVTALALEHDAGRVAFYCLDVGGGGLAPLAELPQVGVVAGRHDADLVRRTVAEIGAVLRRRQRGGPGREDRFGDVFLVVDGWHAIRQDFDGLEQAITTIAAEGLSHGVHVALAATRWADIRPALKDQIGSRIELRLGDPADSEIDRRRARNVPPGCPGRGLSPDGLPFVAALPVGPPGISIGEVIGARYGDRRAPTIRLLPNHIDHDGVLAGIAEPPTAALVIGIDEQSLAAVAIDIEREPHLLVLGDAQSGKTAALRVLCREILRTTSPAQAQLFLVDPRRSMLGEIDGDRLAGYLTTPAALVAQLPELVALLRQRLPGEAVTQHQLRTRSWWTGPDIHLVVDDYDLVATASGNPLAPILDILPHARDIGLHMVIARRHGGAARALYEPVLAAVRDLGAAGLQLSGSSDEGALLGTVRPRPLPPGRGTLSTRSGGEQTVQVAWTTPR